MWKKWKENDIDADRNQRPRIIFCIALQNIFLDRWCLSVSMSFSFHFFHIPYLFIFFMLKDLKTDCYKTIIDNVASARPGVLELMDAAIADPRLKVMNRDQHSICSLFFSFLLFLAFENIFFVFSPIFRRFREFLLKISTRLLL